MSDQPPTPRGTDADTRRRETAHPADRQPLPVGELQWWEIADALWLARHHPHLTAQPRTAATPPDPQSAAGHPNPTHATHRDRTPAGHEKDDRAHPSQSGRDTPARPPAATGPSTATSPQSTTSAPQELPETAAGPAPSEPARLQGEENLKARTQARTTRPGRTERFDAAGLGRALRPLRQTAPTGRALEVDEEATAERLAEDTALPPVTHPAPEPCWDVVLIVDTAPQMAVWRDTAVHLASVLRHYGNFHDFQVRLLNAEVESENAAALLRYPGAAGTARPQSPKQLVDPAGRRIVLVLTDGLAAAWQNGAMHAVLATWARHQPVAVLHVLPERLWYRTGVDPQMVRLRASGPWRAGTQWEHTDPADALNFSPSGDRRLSPVPVLEVTGDYLAPWTRFLAGNEPRWVELPALLVPSRPASTTPRPQETIRPATDPAERVAHFRAWASRDSFTLATRLAAAPLELPVMASLQRRVMPRTGPAHLAEVLMSDLIEAPRGGDGNFYAFYPGVREELLASSTRHATERALKVAAEYLAPHSGAARELLAHFGGIDVPGEPEVTGENLQFREIEHAVLEALSGTHLRRARRIERHLRSYDESIQAAGAPAHGAPHSPNHTESSVIVNPSDVPEAPTPSVRRQKGEVDAFQGGTAVTTAPPDVTSGPGVVLSRTSPVTRPVVMGNMPPRNLVFTGREDLLQQLERELRDGPTAVLPHALHGMGGVGKSQLALEYVYRQASQYDIVWWIPAERPAQTAQALVELAQRLGLPVSTEAITAVPAVLEALRTGSPYNKWLLVFDNAESPEVVQDYFPSNPEGGPSGSILITSRNPQWNTLARPLEVDVFQRQESIELLQRRNPDLADGEADQLAEVLGDLPLAVEQASAWRAETGMPAEEYLRLFEEKRAELMTVSPPTHYEQTVATAWNVSLDHLATKNPTALQLLQICAFFASAPIARSLFSGAPVEPIAPDLDRALTDPLRLGRAIREINRYSLAKIDHRNNSIQMHRLVQAVLIARMTEEQRTRMRHGAHLLLAASAPRDPRDPEHWARFGDLYPHVVVSEAIQAESGNVRQMIIYVAQYLYYWGDHEGAREFGQDAYKVWLQKFGAGDPQTLLLCRDLWYVLWRMGRYQEAADLTQRVLAEVESQGEEEEEALLYTLSQVAIDRRVQGKFREALEIAKQVYERALHIYGEDDPTTLDHTHNYAVALRSCGHFQQALELDQATWRRNVQMYGEESYDSLLSEMGLALDRREAGDYAAGLRMFRAIVDKYRSVFGENNPHTLRAQARFAVSLRKAGDHNAALELSTYARKTLKERYGQRSPDSLVASLNLSVDLRQTGSLEDALRLGQSTRDLYVQVFGSGHPDAVAADINLAITLRLMNQVDTARALNETAVERARAALGDTHPIVLVATINLASDIFAQGDAASALELDRKTLGLVTSELGEEHPTALVLMSNIAVDLRALHRTEEAEAMHTAALEGLRSRLGPDHPACTDVLEWRRANCDVDPMPS